MKKKLVIFSGGLDSTAMALLAKEVGESTVTVMSFSYGQKASMEITRAREFAAEHNMDFIFQDISSLKSIFGKTQLTDNDSIIKDEYNKSVVVPLRNALFLQIAFIYAYSNGFDEILLGSHLDDCLEVDGDRLFPDCSPEFFKAFQLAMDFGTFRNDKKVQIITASTLGLHKTDLIQIAYDIDSKALFNSWSCYTSDSQQCGVCDSCRNRKKAFKDAGISDLTDYKIKD